MLSRSFDMNDSRSRCDPVAAKLRLPSSLSLCTKVKWICGSCTTDARDILTEMSAESNEMSVSTQKCQTCHDGEAEQDEHHLKELIPGGIQLMRENLQESDVNKRACSEPLQHGLDQRSGCQLSLHHTDADGDA